MDATHLQKFLSDAARRATRSEIRELLKLIAKPEGPPRLIKGRAPPHPAGQSLVGQPAVGQ